MQCYHLFINLFVFTDNYCGLVVQWVGCWTCDHPVAGFRLPRFRAASVSKSFTHYSASVTVQYNLVPVWGQGDDAAGRGTYPYVWLCTGDTSQTTTCGLTAFEWETSTSPCSFREYGLLYLIYQRFYIILNKFLYVLLIFSNEGIWQWCLTDITDRCLILDVLQLAFLQLSVLLLYVPICIVSSCD